MTRHIRRVLVAGLALVALTGAPLVAQTPPTPPAPSPAIQTPPTPTPTPRLAVPAVTPEVPQRFEQPAARRAADRLTPEQRAEAERDRLAQLRARVYRPVLRIGQPYVLKAGDTTRDVSGVMADVRIEGHVEGDVVVVLGDVTLAETAQIDGSLVVVAGSVHAVSGAKVDRELVLVGGTLDAPPDFVPQGEHVVIGTAAMGSALRAFAPWITRGLLLGRVIVPGLPWMWTLIGVVFLLGLVLNLLFNKPVAACADTLARRPLSTFMMGLLTLALLPVVIVILAATVVGLVVVPFAIAAFFVAVLVGRISVTRALGRVIAGESEPASRFQASRSFLIGTVVIVFAYMVPIVGILAWMFVGSFGLGAAVMTFFASLRRERPARPPKPVPPPAPAAPTEPAGHVPFAAPAAPAFSGEPQAPVSGAAFELPAADVPFAPAAPAPPLATSAAVPQPAAPPPMTGSDLTLYPRASFFDRLAAVALDLVLVGIAAAFLGFGRYEGPGPFFALLFAYHVAFWSWKGTTLGGIICSLRVVRTNNVPLRFVDALVRGLSGIFSMVALGIGYFWMLNDAERQTWHDKIAGTVVVKLPRELVLE
jgi:uncharacterized RDD family membrane protein YckC